MQKIIPILLLLAGLAVSATAAYYSVFGLSKLFAGAAIQVAVMATTLEVAKLITASAAYRYWKVLSTLLKIYLSTAVIVLILITSLGAYGYLSSAYETTSSLDKISMLKTERVESNLSKYQNIKADYSAEKLQVLNEINSLRKGVSTVVNAGESKSAINNAAFNRKLIQKQLDDAIRSRDKLDAKLATVNDSIFKYEGTVIDTKVANNETSELGPLKYLSRITGVEMDSIVNWFILLIVLVLDPLAVALLLAASSILLHTKKEPITIIPEILEVAEEIISPAEVLGPSKRNIKPLAPKKVSTPPPPPPAPQEPKELKENQQPPDRPVFSDIQLRGMTEEQRADYLRKTGS